jgi:hypothetical protein
MWKERHVQILNAVKTSKVGLGLLGGYAKVFKEKVRGGKTDRAELTKLLRRIEPGDVLGSVMQEGARRKVKKQEADSAA